jgi:two-component system phosphate regulon sensor histidine kinase PhoR
MIGVRAMVAPVAALSVGLALHALFGPLAAAGWLALALLALAALQAFRLGRLHRWAALPRQRDLPQGTGAWGRLLDRIGRFARQEQQTRDELNEELGQLHAAVDQLPDGLTLIDRFDHVEWCNNAAAELHGIFATGRPVHHFVRQPEFVDYLDSGNFARPPVIALAARPGRLYELRLHPVGDGGKLLITRDVTEQSKLDSMRKDFVANVSHEIRTPVTVISGFAETLLDLELDAAAQREYLAMILKQSKTMQRLVDDLLTLSSLENASAPGLDDDVDLRAMANSLAEEARILSQGRHTIELRIDKYPALRANAAQVESAIRNLLTNAVRYTPQGGRISIDWRIRDGFGELRVCDTGIGIAAEHLPRLAERFYRVDRGRSRETGGTGLGLAIVKHIMSQHGGQMRIESTPAQGSAFTLRFPGRRVLETHPGTESGQA